MTSDQVREILRKRIERDGLRETARQLEISAPYLYDIIKSNREPSETIAGKLGLKRVTTVRVQFVRA